METQLYWTENCLITDDSNGRNRISYADLEQINPDSLPEGELKKLLINCQFRNDRVNFSGRSQKAPWFQIYRARQLLKKYPGNFTTTSKAYCVLAYRMLHDNAGDWEEIQRVKEEALKLGMECKNKSHVYRWQTSTLTAAAHLQVKEKNKAAARFYFENLSTVGDISLHPNAMANIIGACYSIGEYDKGEAVFLKAIKTIEVENKYHYTEIRAGLNLAMACNLTKNKAFKALGKVPLPALYWQAHKLIIDEESKQN